jgi:hypothetical protein
MRGRSNNSTGNNNVSRKGGGSRNQSFDSNGPDVKVRGNAQQVVEKYLTLARDASVAGDRITAESYYQFAEHYYRVMNANAANEQQRQQQNAGQQSDGDSTSDNSPAENSVPESRIERTSDAPEGAESSETTETIETIEIAETANSTDSIETAGAVEAIAETSPPTGEGNGRGRRRNSRGAGRSKSAEKDPAEQPQPEVAAADEPATEDAGEGANV